MMLTAEKVFARKVLSIPYLDPKIIANEARAVRELCTPGAHPNIIAVIMHGELPSAQLYFIDMELCDINLSQYIHGAITLPSIPNFTRDPQQIGQIMKHIASGVKYIHSRNVVHRDLKPDNGIASSIFF